MLLRPGFHREPRWGAHSAPADPLHGFQEPLYGREWAGREGKARGKGKVEGWREGEGKKWEELRKGKGKKEGK